MLSDHFDSKQSREAVDLLLTCHPSPSLNTFAFRSSEVRHLFLDLDPYGGTDPLSMFPLFVKRTTDVMAPRLSVVFRRLVRLDSFPACCRQANVTPIPKVHCPLLFNHQGILYKLCFVGIGGSVLSKLTQFPSNR